MNLIKSLSFTFFLFSISIFSQNNKTIYGTVSAEDKILSDVVIELKIDSISKYTISDKKGNYKFSNCNGSKFELKFKYLGYKIFVKKIDISQDKEQININLTELDIQNIQEVVVKGSDKVISSARKVSYKIDAKQFIKNAKAPEILNTLPNVYYNENSTGALVDGNISATIFLDGIQLIGNELKMIDIADIDRAEVINNPSQSYGSEFTGAVINLISKKKTEEFFKGSIASSRSLRLDNWFVDPTLSYKKGIFTIKTSFEYKTNNQVLRYNLNRTNEFDKFYQSNKNNTHGIQKSSETRINIKFSEKSNFTISNLLFGYKFRDDIKGSSILNDDSPILYTKKGENGNVNWNINSVYTYKINDNKRLFLKSKYLVFDNFNRSNFVFSDATSNFFNIESTNKDLSFAIDYEAEELKLLKINSAFYTGAKFINRNFSFSNTDFFVKQNVLNLYAEIDFEFTDKFSSEFSFAYENTKNTNDVSLNQSYNYFLPTINLMYKFSKTFNSKLGYSRKILRPNANDLNDELIIYNPGQATQGNANLLPQIRNYYFLTFSKSIKKDNISFRLYNENINNSIANTYRLEGDLLVQTLGNASKYNASGINFGYRTRLFDKVNANLNTGFDYSIYEDKTQTALIPETDGYTFRGSLSLSTNIFKDKISLSLSGNQNGPNYSLLSKSVRNPYVDFSASTNLLKDKINLNLYAGNIFGTASNMKNITSYTDFYQISTVKNNTTNISLSITYNFGKKFNDNINNTDIYNNDIR